MQEGGHNTTIREKVLKSSSTFKGVETCEVNHKSTQGRYMEFWYKKEISKL